MKKYILALDQGTTSSRAILFDHSQSIVAAAQREFSQIYPREGYVEHSPLEIYASQSAVMTEVLAKANVHPREIEAIGITNQRETTILWDRLTGEPVYNAIVWQCRRTAPICEQLRAAGMGDYIHRSTGLFIDAYFSATKIKWILDNVPGVRSRAEAGEILFGTVDSWLLYKLTEGRVHATDVTNASRTMLYNIAEGRWDERLLAELDIPACILPQVKPSACLFGHTNIGGEQVPIAGVAGDQQAALFGQLCLEPGQAKNTYGTGCFLLMNTGGELVYSNSGLLTTIAASPPGVGVQYALEGSVFIAGALVQWLRDELGIVADAVDTEYFATRVPDNGGVYIVPAFTGLGAPHWDMYARGTIFGLTRGTGRNHLVRAGLEAIAYQAQDVLCAMERDTGRPLHSLRVDGGASANNFLMQFQADISGSEVLRPQVLESTALGTALLAGLTTGYWATVDDVIAARSAPAVFVPAMPAEQRDALYSRWQRAVRQAGGWLSE